MIKEFVKSSRISICLEDTKYVCNISNTKCYPRESKKRSGHSPVETGLIWRIVEHLQKLRSTQMIHKLRIQRKVFRQSEAIWIVLSVFSELLALQRQRFTSQNIHITNVFLVIISIIKDILTSLISMRSTHLSTSGPSSLSALNTAKRDIRTAAASWSNPALTWCKDDDASAQLQEAKKIPSWNDERKTQM